MIYEGPDFCDLYCTRETRYFINFVSYLVWKIRQIVRTPDRKISRFFAYVKKNLPFVEYVCIKHFPYYVVGSVLLVWVNFCIETRFFRNHLFDEF